MSVITVIIGRKLFERGAKVTRHGKNEVYAPPVYHNRRVFRFNLLENSLRSGRWNNDEVAVRKNRTVVKPSDKSRLSGRVNRPRQIRNLSLILRRKVSAVIYERLLLKFLSGTRL